MRVLPTALCTLHHHHQELLLSLVNKGVCHCGEGALKVTCLLSTCGKITQQRPRKQNWPANSRSNTAVHWHAADTRTAHMASVQQAVWKLAQRPWHVALVKMCKGDPHIDMHRQVSHLNMPLGGKVVSRHVFLGIPLAQASGALRRTHWRPPPPPHAVPPAAPRIDQGMATTHQPSTATSLPNMFAPAPCVPLVFAHPQGEAASAHAHLYTHRGHHGHHTSTLDACTSSATDVSLS